MHFFILLLNEQFVYANCLANVFRHEENMYICKNILWKYIQIQKGPDIDLFQNKYPGQTPQIFAK